MAAVDSESPDFVLDGSPSVGIEFTDFDARSASFPDGVREQSSLRVRAVELAEQLYYANHPSQAWDVDLEFRDWPPLTKARVSEVAESLSRLLVLGKDFVQIDNYEFMGSHPVPQLPEVGRIQAKRVTTRDHGVWQIDSGGWVRHVGLAEIETVVRAKEKRLSHYRQSAHLIWLVIVFDIYSAGDRVAGPMFPVAFSVPSTFDRVQCLDLTSRRVVEIPITLYDVSRREADKMILALPN